MKTVKEIYDFFQQSVSAAGKDLGQLASSDSDFTIKKTDGGLGAVDMTLVTEYYKICEKMVEDGLMTKSVVPVKGVNNGKVFGTVVHLPFDDQSSSDAPRYDIMGFGICLPSKYTLQLLDHHEAKELREDNGYYRFQ